MSLQKRRTRERDYIDPGLRPACYAAPVGTLFVIFVIASVALMAVCVVAALSMSVKLLGHLADRAAGFPDAD